MTNTTQDQSNMKPQTEELSTETKEGTPEAVIPKLPTYTHEQLRDALMFVQDIFERADMPYFPWNNTLEHIVNKEEELTGDSELHIAIKRQEWQKQHVSILDMWSHGLTELDDHTQSFKSLHDIPVIIHILDTDYPFLKYPDIAHYWIEDFQIPNPMSAYYECKKGLV